jgi:hypothetical protein
VYVRKKDRTTERDKCLRKHVSARSTGARPSFVHIAQLINEHKFALAQTLKETVHSKQDEIEVVLLITNIYIEHMTKVYDMHVLHSYICGATSWYLAN